MYTYTYKYILPPLFYLPANPLEFHVYICTCVLHVCVYTNVYIHIYIYYRPSTICRPSIRVPGICICTCIWHVYVYMYTYTYIYTTAPLLFHTPLLELHVYVYVHVYICILIYIYYRPSTICRPSIRVPCTCICICTCMWHVYVYTCAYICIYTTAPLLSAAPPLELHVYVYVHVCDMSFICETSWSSTYIYICVHMHTPGGTCCMCVTCHSSMWHFGVWCIYITF